MRLLAAMAGSDEPTTDEARDQILEDLAIGVNSFSDGTHNASIIDPVRRLDALDRISGNKAAKNPMRGLRFTKLIPPSGG